ncbi:MAG: response regulator transcription factor [Desulfobulbus sp.]|jgi:DNA-binding response OmpR family regulator|nr:response regulator transcription factor [Desulfobulbus sp.]
MSTPHPYTLLLFEDDPFIRDMLVVFFTAQGLTVRTAADGRNALARIRADQPDLILLDVVLPFQDGFTILDELRRAGDKTPVILLTEKSGVDDKVTGLDHGADDYLTKPFSPAELLARIRVQLRRTTANQEPAPQPLTVGPVTIDPAAREALLADRSRLPLTKTEFDLLYYLAAKGRAVASHAELLKEVLGYEPETETKSLVMHIANIRRKLDKACPNALTIRAVAGVGYKLIAGEAS